MQQKIYQIDAFSTKTFEGNPTMVSPLESCLSDELMQLSARGGEVLYCLHGLNWIYLKEFGWYRVDARGNKEGVDAQFNPPYEKLAFELQENEFDLSENLSEPLPVIIDTLRKYKSYDEMVDNFPDVKNKD